MAASHSVPEAFAVHSVHAYFIRRGDAAAPIRFEVDRIRDGRTFFTRRVVARQSTGAILNMSASFHLPEAGLEASLQRAPEAPPPETLPQDSWTPILDRRMVPREPSSGRGSAWFRIQDEVGDAPIRHACALAFASATCPWTRSSPPPDRRDLAQELFATSPRSRDLVFTVRCARTSGTLRVLRAASRRQPRAHARAHLLAVGRAHRHRRAGAARASAPRRPDRAPAAPVEDVAFDMVAVHQSYLISATTNRFPDASLLMPAAPGG